MTRVSYSNNHYESIARWEMDEGMDYHIEFPTPDSSLKSIKLALLMGPCPEEPEIVVPLDFLKASGAQVDVIAPDWTPQNWLPATRFWAPTIKIPYQKKISAAVVTDYQGVILVGGAWNPAVVRTDSAMLTFIRIAANNGLPIFSICHGAQILISAGLITKGLKITGSPDIRIDLRNAGAEVVEDQAVVTGNGNNFKIISSRDPNDVAFFCRAIADYYRK